MLAVKNSNISTHEGTGSDGKKLRWPQSGKDVKGKDRIWTHDKDLVGKIKAQAAERNTWTSTLYLAYGSLGVIYGDIGTSIIYVFGQIFAEVDLRDSEDLRTDVYGAISLIFWTLTLIALFKYVFVVLRANDTGEGGTVALYAQLCRTMGISPFGTMRMEDHKQVLALRSAGGKLVNRPKIGEHRHRQIKKEAAKAPAKNKKKPYFKPYEKYMGFAVFEQWYITRVFRRSKFAQRSLLVLAIIATGLVIGDGILMPAFSVNSAIAGINENGGDGISSGAIVGISVAIIIFLFFLQHFGTQKLAYLFSPIIILWLLSNLAIGIYHLRTYGGGVFAGLSPEWIYRFFDKYRSNGWEMLSGVMLCVAGTETMFAAMGHFSQPAVAVAFTLFAYPCLMISYLGQGAYLLNHPEDAQNAYFASLPRPIFWPMLILATLAAIVASQAVITGTFSIIRQATMLGVFPKLRIVHTDSFVEGQIFIPLVNYTLMVLCIIVVAAFNGDSVKLGDAYGVAVMAVMLITTVLVTLIMAVKWTLSILFIVPFLLFFFFIEAVFLSSTLSKVPYGGWVPLAVAAVVLLISMTWWAGQYARRRLMVASAKELHATNFLKQFTGGGPGGPAPFGGNSSFRYSKAGGDMVESAMGSAVDLGTVPVYSTGYAAFEAMDDDNIVVGSHDRDTGQSELPELPGVQKRNPLARFSAVPAKMLGLDSANKGDSSKKDGDSSQRGAAAAPKPRGGLFRASASPALTLGTKAKGPGSGPVSAPKVAGRPLAEGTEIEAGTDGASWALGMVLTEIQKTSLSRALAPGEPIAEAAEPDKEDVNVSAASDGSRRPPSPLCNSSSMGRGDSGQVTKSMSQLGRIAVENAAQAGAEGGDAPGLPKARPRGVSFVGSVKFVEGAALSEAGSDVSRPNSAMPSRKLERCKSSLALVAQPDKALSVLTGLGIFYSDSPVGIPPVMTHFLRNIDAMHEVVIILTVRFLPMPAIMPIERLLVRSIDGVPNFYQVVARYGYQDQVDHGPAFVSNVISTILHKLELKAGLQGTGLENDYIQELEGGVETAADDKAEDEEADEEQGDGTNAAAAMAAAMAPPELYASSMGDAASSHGVSFVSHPSPYISRFALNALERIRVVAGEEGAPVSAQEALAMAEALLDTVGDKVVYYQGRAFTRAKVEESVAHTFVVGTLYRSLEMISYNDSEAWSIPLENMVELGMALEI